jgi:glycosyltransferase involved in cell wall biosynthesis
MLKPDISILIPTYNGANYLETCLDSVLSQTFDNIEILVVDDRSTDATFEILKRYAATDQRVRLFHNERNLGLVGNWNRCLTLARGRWIKFLFQDDLLESSCIEKMLHCGERTGCPFVACRRDFIFENVPQSTHDLYQRFSTDISMDAAMEGRTHLAPDQFCDVVLKFGSAKNFVGEPSSTLIRHDVFQQYGGFNASMIQLCDLELWLRVGVNYGIAYVPETLAHFRVHPSSATSHNSVRRQLLKDVVDPLLLFRDFAVSANYRRLRSRASENGINLKREYYDSLSAELFRLKMGIPVRSGQVSEDEEQLEAFRTLYTSAPIPLSVRGSLGAKLAKMKLERLIDRHVTWRFRKN